MSRLLRPDSAVVLAAWCVASLAACEDGAAPPSFECERRAVGSPLPGPVLVPPGSNIFGNYKPYGSSGTGFVATFTRGLVVMAHEVTRGDWLEFVETDPTRVCGAPCSAQFPVDSVRWTDSLWYANQRSLADGLVPCYDLAGCHGKPGTTLVCDDYQGLAFELTCEGWRLPTVLEWEYMARAGDKKPSPCYTTDPNYGGWTNWEPCLHQVAWVGSTGRQGTQAVATLCPNRWGIYDAIGNVLEYSWDGDPLRELLNTTPRTEFVDAVYPSFERGPLALGASVLQDENYAHYGYGEGAGPIAPPFDDVITEGPVTPSPYVGFRLVRTAKAADYVSRGLDVPDNALP